MNPPGAFQLWLVAAAARSRCNGPTPSPILVNGGCGVNNAVHILLICQPAAPEMAAFGPGAYPMAYALLPLSNLTVSLEANR